MLATKSSRSRSTALDPASRVNAGLGWDIKAASCVTVKETSATVAAIHGTEGSVQSGELYVGLSRSDSRKIESLRTPIITCDANRAGKPTTLRNIFVADRLHYILVSGLIDAMISWLISHRCHDCAVAAEIVDKVHVSIGPPPQPGRSNLCSDFAVSICMLYGTIPFLCRYAISRR